MEEPPATLHFLPSNNNTPQPASAKPRKPQKVHQQEKAAKEDEWQHECDQCAATFRRFSNLLLHLQRHAGVRPFSCPQCPATFVEDKNLKRHLVTHRARRPYTCHECGLTFVESSNLARHRLTHAGPREFVCESCGAGFSKGVNLKEHLKGGCGSKDLGCPECAIVFNNAFQLRKHVKSAHSTGKGRSYVCPQCGQKFGWWSIFHRHLSTHRGERPFVCDKCDLTFTDNVALRLHKRSHTRERTYACEVCSAAFDRPSHLQRHRNSHNGEKPNVCLECGAAFAERNKLVRHSSVHSGVGAMICELCGAKFSQARFLTRHMLTHLHVRSPQHSSEGKVEQNKGKNTDDIKEIKNEDNTGETCLEMTERYNKNCLLASYQIQKNEGDVYEKTESVSNNCIFFSTESETSSPSMERTRKNEPQNELALTSQCENVKHELVNSERTTETKELKCLQSAWCKSESSDTYENDDTLSNNNYDDDNRGDIKDEKRENESVHAYVDNLNESYTGFSRDQEMPDECESMIKRDVECKPQVLVNLKSIIDRGLQDTIISQIQTGIGTLKDERKTEVDFFTPITGFTREENATDTSGISFIQQQSKPPLETNQLIHCPHSNIQFPGAHTLSRVEELNLHPRSLPASVPAPIPQPTEFSEPEVREEEGGFVLFPCPHCNAVFNSPFSLKLHKRIHRREQVVCVRCSLVCSSSDDLAAHCVAGCTFPDQSSRAGEAEVGNQLHPCKLCGAAFSQLNKLKLHVNLHGDGARFTCTRCGASFRKSADLRAHARTHTGQRPYVCGECGASYTQASSLSVHAKTHSGHKPHVCKVCDAKFPRYGRLQVHMRVHTGEKPFECKECGATFKWSQTLLRHVSSQHAADPFPCQQCAQTFSTEDALVRHRGCHAAERPFLCRQCPKTFKKRVQMERHLLTHSRRWPFLCHLCGAGFVSAASLKIHSRCHTGEKPFVCEACGRAFRISSHLTRHMKSHTDDPVLVRKEPLAKSQL